MMIAQKMIEDPREKELQNNQEGETSEAKHKMRGIRQWSSMSNPRIVRVSRAFGGKDRHSKVSTIRGLRDRRVRLSVPTAIQLYDLQDKLNLNQPSKVVDWLIDAAQHEIDKLPPLPLIPPSHIQFPQAMASFSATDHVVNDEGISNTANPMLSPSFAEDTELFPKFRGTTKDIDAMPYTSYQQMEPSNSYTSAVAENSSQEFHLPSELSSRFLMPGTQFMLPTMSSSYVHSPNHFQHPSTFAQLLQSNFLGINTNMYSSTNFRQYISHQEQHHEAQHEDSMRERSSHEVASPIYKNSGAADESNTASFL